MFSEFSVKSTLQQSRAIFTVAAIVGLMGCGPKAADSSATMAVPAATQSANLAVPSTNVPAPPTITGTQTANAARVGQPVPAAPSTFQVPAPNDGSPALAPPPQSAPSVQAPPQTQPTQVARAQAPAPVSVNTAHRGSVSSIEEIREKPSGTGAGAVIGGVLGAVVGNQFGHGNGRAAMTLGGAAGGAFAGNAVEKKVNEKVVGYRVSVRLDNGQSRTYQEPSLDGLRVGDRVRVEGNRLRRA
jgi:outer membrane lipoprotein SlyB